jgi:4,5-dihydroxyphthalate decarboxylase
MGTGELLEIEFPVMRYDITMPLLEGRVEVEGVKLKPVKASSMVSKEDPKLKSGDFGLRDLNVGYFLPAIEAGWELIGLPVFSKRKPIFQLIFCHADSGIRAPKDLEGKRIGTRTYRTGITVWVRGLLQDRYGVDFRELRWVVQAKEVFPVHDQEAKIEYVDGKKHMVERLVDGEVDAIITDISDAKLFETLENHPKVKRLFLNYMDEDRKLYKETGIYTPAHMIVMSKKLDREHPDLAAKFYTAFDQAKKTAYEDILNDRAGFSVVYLRERLKEQFEAWGDPFQYGIKANRSTIDTMIRHNHEQGMIRTKPSYQEIFAEGTLQS